jgi:hypothetical protein
MRRTVVAGRRPDEPEGHREPDAAGPAHAVLALQRAAGNRAVAGLLQRAPVGYIPGSRLPGPYFDDHLGAYVTVGKELPGLDPGRPWLVLTEQALNEHWLYQPASGLLPEAYTKWWGDDDYRVKLVAAKVKRDEAAVGATLETTGWQPSANLKQRQAQTATARAELCTELQLGVGAWEEYLRRVARRDALVDDDASTRQTLRVTAIVQRVRATFPQLIKSLDPTSNQQQVEFTGELAELVHNVIGVGQKGSKLALPKNETSPPPVLSEKEETEAGQHLAELDYAMIVLAGQAVAEPLVVGARGRMLPPDMAKVPPAEAEHGGLPPLNVLNLEADAYYMTADGVLHLDEVKDTPNALGQKLKAGEQIGRHIEWMNREIMNPATHQPRVKRVGYYCRATQPKFDGVLSEDVISNLELLGSLQPGVAFVRIGDAEMTPAALRELYTRAIAWLRDSRDALKEDPEVLKDGKVDNSSVFRKYFDSLALTRQTLDRGALKPKGEAT